MIQSSTPQPHLTETLFTKWSSVTSQGGRIVLPDSNISLTVPEGSICPGQTKDESGQARLCSAPSY